MKLQAITLIKDEHWAISAVLLTLTSLVRTMRRRADDGKEPDADFALLKAMLDYIVSYPERWHHPKEEQVLFPAIRRRTREADGLLEELGRDHEQGALHIGNLQQKLLAFKRGEPGAREAFFDATDEYAQYQWMHIGKEERLLLPLAQRVLTDDDWREVSAAFHAMDNPPFGMQPRVDAENMYRRILDLAPAPIGYGPPEA